MNWLLCRTFMENVLVNICINFFVERDKGNLDELNRYFFIQIMILKELYFSCLLLNSRELLTMFRKLVW